MPIQAGLTADESALRERVVAALRTVQERGTPIAKNGLRKGLDRAVAALQLASRPDGARPECFAVTL